MKKGDCRLILTDVNIWLPNTKIKSTERFHVDMIV